MTGTTPLPIPAYVSPSMLTGCPRVYQRASPRAVTMTPSVAMKAGIPVRAMSVPFTRPAAAPTASPATTGTITGRSMSEGYTGRTASADWARLAATMAVSATTDPEDRSMPPVMMTWVTPMAMMPITDTCRIITTRRCSFSRKLCRSKIQPSSSNPSARPTSTMRILSSGGQRRDRGAAGVLTVCWARACGMCFPVAYCAASAMIFS